MIELKNHLKDVIKKFYQILERKRIQKGKLLVEEELIYESLRNPKKGDVKIIVILDKVYHIFFESKKQKDSYLSLMNDVEAKFYPERRPLDYYVGSNQPEENYNLYIPSISDLNLIKEPKENRWEFYSIELEIIEHFEKPKEEIPKDLEALNLDEKWKIYVKLDEFDPRKQELRKLFFGFKLKYRRYKSPEEERMIIIEPEEIVSKVGMIAREIYPLNLRIVLRRDFKKDHQELSEYTKKVLNKLSEMVQERKKNFTNSVQYIEYLQNMEKEIYRQINLLEN